MQVNMNTNYSNRQSFGMAVRSSDVVNKALKSRIKTPAQLQELSALIEQASKNEIVNINLFAGQNGKLSANVYSVSQGVADNPNYFCKSFSEGFFGGPVKFIKKLVNYADSEAAKIEKRCDVNELDDVLNKML